MSSADSALAFLADTAPASFLNSLFHSSAPHPFRPAPSAPDAFHFLLPPPPGGPAPPPRSPHPRRQERVRAHQAHARTHARVPATGVLRLIVPYRKSCCPACPEPAYCGLLRLTARDATKALNQIPPSPTRSSSSACCTRCLGRRLPAVEAGSAVPRQPKQAGEGQAGRLPPRPSRLACPPRRLPVCRYTCRSACLPACLPVSVQAADGAAETSRRLAARCLNRVRARVHAAAGSRARIFVAARSLNRVIACAPACGVWA